MLDVGVGADLFGFFTFLTGQFPRVLRLLFRRHLRPRDCSTLCTEGKADSVGEADGKADG